MEIIEQLRLKERRQSHDTIKFIAVYHQSWLGLESSICKLADPSMLANVKRTDLVEIKVF